MVPVGKQWGFSGGTWPGPVPRGVPGIDRPHHHPYPRVPRTPPLARHRVHGSGYSGQHGFTRLLLVTVSLAKYHFFAKPPLLDTTNDTTTRHHNDTTVAHCSFALFPLGLDRGFEVFDKSEKYLKIEEFQTNLRNILKLRHF